MGDIIAPLVQLAFAIVAIAGLWKVFQKADQPGWAAIVPFYNLYVMLQIANKPVWWMVLFFVPIVNFIVAIIVSIGIAERFGKGTGFGVGLAFLGFIFYPLLGFGDAQYNRHA